MEPRDVPLFVEAYLVIDQPRQRHSHWVSALAILDDRRAPPVASVSAHYEPATDQALIGLCYDESTLGADALAFVVEVAMLEEIGMIQPAELTQGDRTRFLTERLARCAISVTDQPGVVDALHELVRRIREHKAATSRPAVLGAVPVRPSSVPPPIPAARALPARGDTEEPVLLVKAKGTRDDLSRPGPAAPTADEPSRVERSPGRGGALSPHVIPRAELRPTTTPMSAVEAYRKATSSMPPPLPRRARSPSQSSTDTFMPAPSAPMPPGIIYARYLRSGRWVPIRIGALSLKGAALMSGALPRVHDHVDVALSFGSHRALVRGNVGKVSSHTEAAMTGTATFSVSFQLDDASRRQLTALLTAARAANVTIKPPPPRAARRFPVEWPVGLGTSRGVVRAEALDLSRDGMFVRPLHALELGALVNFSSVLDEGEPVAGRARVVRHITEAEAKACGLIAGYGVQIAEMGDDDRERWLGFIGRIEKRAERRVLIGAAPARLAELQAALAAVGYAVTGGTDPGALVQLAATEARPVDAALIDAAWLTPSMSAEWVESLFAARNVPCVTLHGDAKRARAAIDRLLSVA